MVAHCVVRNSEVNHLNWTAAALAAVVTSIPTWGGLVLALVAVAVARISYSALERNCGCCGSRRAAGSGAAGSGRHHSVSLFHCGGGIAAICKLRGHLNIKLQRALWWHLRM